jgi:hypothetical protein
VNIQDILRRQSEKAFFGQVTDEEVLDAIRSVPAHFANTVGDDILETFPYSVDSQIRIYAEPPGSGSVTYYAGQAVGRDASGLLVQMDDTAKAEFLGVLVEPFTDTTVASTDGTTDKRFDVFRPLLIRAKIASAAPGDEQKIVYWKFNNEVSYSPGTNGNVAGTVIQVDSSAVAGTTYYHVLFAPPWSITPKAGAGIYTAAAAAATTLTKYDFGKLVILPLTSSEAITLPAASSGSPGFAITFINTSANTSTPTLTAAGSDTINGAATYAMSTAQYSTVVLRSDGVSKWYVEVPGPSGTVGSTTFSGNVAVSSATLVVTDNVANAFAVGPNGATNPSFTVDTSATSAITGINVIAAASGSGVKVNTLGGTNETITVNAKGTGALNLGSTTASTTAFTVQPAASGSGLALSATGGGTNENLTLDAKGSGTISFGSVSTGNVLFGTGALVNGGTGGIGYGTGVGGTVSQASSRTTTVVLNKLTGAITLVSAAGSATPFTFTVTNSTVAATDTVVASQKSGTDAYAVDVSAVAAGSFKLTITDLTGTTTETPVFNFAVIKAVAA